MNSNNIVVSRGRGGGGGGGGGAWGPKPPGSLSPIFGKSVKMLDQHAHIHMEANKVSIKE